MVVSVIGDVEVVARNANFAFCEHFCQMGLLDSGTSTLPGDVDLETVVFLTDGVNGAFSVRCCGTVTVRQKDYMSSSCSVDDPFP